MLLRFLVVLAMTASAAFANSNRKVSWKTFETAHFEILYHDDVAPQARLARVFLEEAYAKIAADLGMRERGITITVVMTGIIDESNGFSSPLGHRIVLYTRPMQVLASGDIAWLKRVLAHELTHQITFLALRKSGWGIYSELYKTHALPDWFLEGLAQYEAESWDAKRNTFFAHVLYNSALEPYPDLATYTKEDPVTGRLIYEQGHAFMRFLAAKQGQRFFARVLARIQVIPVWNELKALLSPLTASYLPLENALREESGKDIRELYGEFLFTMNAGLPPYARATHPLRGGVSGFAVVFQEKIIDSSAFIFTGQAKMDQPVVALFESRAGVVRSLGPRDVNPVFDLSPDGKRIAFVRTSNDVDGDPRERLYVAGLHDEGETLVSDGAAHPAFLGNDTLAFSHYAHGRQALAICVLGRDRPACREEAPDSLVGFYALSRSARGLLLNATDTAGRTGIYEYAPGAGFSAVYRNGPTGEFPVEAPDGKVLMLRDREGLLEVDALDRATGGIAPAATFPLGTFYLHRAGPGISASVAQTGYPGHWGLQPVAVTAPASIPPPPGRAEAAADSAGVSGTPPDSAHSAGLASGSARDAAALDSGKSAGSGADSAKSAKPILPSADGAGTKAAAAPVPAASDSAKGKDTLARAPKKAIAVFRRPAFLMAPPPDFPPIGNPGPEQSRDYNSLLGIRPLLLAPAIASTLEGPAFGANVLLQDPLQLHTLTLMGGLGPERDSYGIDYLNQQTSVGISLSATNDYYVADEMDTIPGWRRLDLITTGDVVSAGLDIPFPSPANSFIGMGLRFTAYFNEYHLAGRSDAEDYQILDGWSDSHAAFDRQIFFQYDYLSPYAFAFVHPLWQSDVEVGAVSKTYGSDVFCYLRGTRPLWEEWTITARLEGELLDGELHVGDANPPALGEVPYFRGLRSGNIVDGYAGVDFPIIKGFIGELPVLGLWNYLGGGVFGSYHRREYDEQVADDRYRFFARDSVDFVAGAKVSGLFHIMRSLPIVLSFQAGFDLENGSAMLRSGLEVSGIPATVSLHPKFVPGLGNARRREL